LFAGVLRLIAAPFYLVGKQIHSRYLWLLLQGAVPGVGGHLGASFVESRRGKPARNCSAGRPVGSIIQHYFYTALQNPSFAGKIIAGFPGWLCRLAWSRDFRRRSWRAGTVLLLNYSEMTPAQVVGTDLLFGLVLAVIGSAFTGRLALSTVQCCSNCSREAFLESWRDVYWRGKFPLTS